MKTFQTADVCEIAHQLTVYECARLDIQLNSEDSDEDEEVYSDEAQTIFDRFVIYVENIWEAEGQVNERDITLN